MKLNGYVIVPPLNPWDETHKEEIWTKMSYSSFGLTPTEAWIRHGNIDWNDPDRSIKIQRWHDRGYRLKKTTLEIHDEDDFDFQRP